ncbi:MAG: hypothetical protein ACLFM0_01440 [Spirochaetales bacterium]
MDNHSMSAEELLSRILAAKRAILDSGENPSKVYLSRDQYRRIRMWHASLGDLAEPAADYVGEYKIFQLEVYDDPSGSLIVE